MNDEQVIRRIARIERQFDELTAPEIGIIKSSANVSNPPTDAELTAAFGSVADCHDVIVIDDAGAGTAGWLVVSDGANWWYEGLTKAV